MKKYILLLCLLLTAFAHAENPYRILNNFNGGELTRLLYSREDLGKFHSGCSLLENMIVLPQGAAQKRPGTVYVAESKNNTKIRLLPFEFSTDRSYMIEGGNQYFRFYTGGARVTAGTGTEDLSALNNIIAHWLLNDSASNTAVVDDDGATHDGVASANTEDIDATGKVGAGCFDLDGTYAVSVTDHADFTFVEGVDGDFSLFAWVYVTEAGLEQTILSKWDETYNSQAREWKLYLDTSRKLKMVIADESLLLDSDLVAHWKLNDSAQTATVIDADGATHDGTLADGSNNYTSDHSVAGKTGSNMTNAFDFDGTNDSVKIDDAAVLSFGDASNDSAFSISAWINMDDATSFEIISKLENAKEEWRFFVDSSDKLAGWCIDSSTDNYIGRKYNTAITSSEGSWIHVVMTYDATETSSGVTLYIDGSATDDLDDNTGAYTAMHATAADVYIGFMHKNTIYADGKIDNVMLFSKELSAAEVTALYNSGNGIEELNTVYPSSITDDALDTGWRFITMTYEGENGSWTGGTATNYVDFYVDEVDVDQTATNLSTYSKMEDTSAAPRIGAQESTAGAIEKIWADRLDEIAVFGDVLSSSEISALYDSTGIYEISTPYLTADLFELKYEQSADVLYITHPDYETRKLSRFNNDDWTLTAIGIQTGPFRDQNIEATKTITASATTGSVTLTATGHAPFVAGTTSGHLPSGSAATSKSQAGALFRLIYPIDELEYDEALTDSYDDSTTEDVSWMDGGTLFKGANWTLETRDTWSGTLKIQRNYIVGAAHDATGWEDVLKYTSPPTDDERNVTTTGTEDLADASYRAILTAHTAGSCHVLFSTNQTSHVGIVQITAVASNTSATGTVVKTLASTDATHRWSEGSWSNYRGWPRTVAFYEDRLMFGGNTSQPDTLWGSVTADYENMLSGADDADAVIFTLTSRQVNVIKWLVGKVKLLVGTSGAEWTLSGSADEPLTPSNVKAAQQSTYGSSDIQAVLANESVLFMQRNARKLREMAYNWELDSFVSPDMTILNPAVTGGGVTDTAYQQTPESILWCVRADGQLLGFSYERKEQVTAWHRHITDGSFESVATITGTNETQVWFSVNRTIDGNVVRYIEYFSDRDFGTDIDDAYFVDSGATYTSVSSITDLSWLEGEAVFILADGVELTGHTVTSNTVTLGDTYDTVQIGLPFTCQLKTMPLSFVSQGTIHGKIKRINEVTVDFYNSGDFYIGKDTTNKELITLNGMQSNEDVDRDVDRVTFPLGYDRLGQVLVYQYSPEPLTLIALMLEFMIY